MNSRRLCLLVVALCVLFLSPALFAHHGDAGVDTTKVVTVKGVVTDFQYINPHVQIYVEVKNDQGKMEKWNGEAGNTLALHRHGWNINIIKPGDEITMMGYRAKDGANMLRLEKVVLANGKELNPFPRDY